MFWPPLSSVQKSGKDGSGPVQLSKFLGRDKDDGVRRSVVSGKKCLGVADSNEGGENQGRQTGRNKPHGATEVSELELRLSDLLPRNWEILLCFILSWLGEARGLLTYTPPGPWYLYLKQLLLFQVIELSAWASLTVLVLYQVLIVAPQYAPSVCMHFIKHVLIFDTCKILLDVSTIKHSCCEF